MRIETPIQALRRGGDNETDAPVIASRFRLEARLGGGGFGTVWQGTDLLLGRQVAVKEVHFDAGGNTEEALREAKVAARLSHAAIATLYEVALEDGQVFLVSELVEGETLAAAIAEGSLADRDIAAVGSSICKALEHAHERGVVHRDVKPANVMVLAEWTHVPGRAVAKLVDFGVARAADLAGLTNTGDVVGTLAYMAPEQAEGRRVTPASDAYSIALTLFECFTGTNPVRGKNPAETARKIGESIPALADLRPDLPSELSAVIDAMLDPEPVARPDVIELAYVLDAHRNELSELLPDDRGGLHGWRAYLPWPGLARTSDDSNDEWQREALSAGFTDRLASAAIAGLLTLMGSLLLGIGASWPAVAIVAALVMMLPQAGWMIAAVVVMGLLVFNDPSRPGVAVLVAAGAIPALAIGRLPRWFVAGALIYWWAALAGTASGYALVTALPANSPTVLDRQGHADSAIAALADLFTTNLPAGLALWTLAVLCAPVFLRGESLGQRLAGGSLWVALLSGCQTALAATLAVAVPWSAAVATAFCAGLVLIVTDLSAISLRPRDF